jgi:hypothetical protein
LRGDYDILRKGEKMTDEKICPLTLKAEEKLTKFITVGSPCIKEKCMAWVPAQDIKHDCGGAGELEYIPGHCPLIKRGA